MMSLFSSFDAFCADSSGWSVRFSEPVERRRLVPAPAPEDGLMISGEEIGKKSSVPAPDKAAGKGMRRNPRFAVEMDGVHCFETILPF